MPVEKQLFRQYLSKCDHSDNSRVEMTGKNLFDLPKKIRLSGLHIFFFSQPCDWAQGQSLLSVTTGENTNFLSNSKSRDDWDPVKPGHLSVLLQEEA